MYKKNIFLILISFFFISSGYSQSTHLEKALKTVTGKVISKKSYNLFFEAVLASDNFKRPLLESFDSGKKPLDLSSAIRQHKKQINRNHQKAIKGLKEIVKIFHISDRKTLERILSDFHRETTFEERESAQDDWRSEDLHRKKAAANYFSNFINEVEDRYSTSKISSSQRKAINLFHEILDSEVMGKKEIRLLRKVLSELGLPAHVHHDEFLRLYLLELKEQQIAAEKERGFQQRTKDRDILKGIERTKEYFDNQHFGNLKEMTRFANIIKGFPMQYVLFQAAIGAMIYRENVTDPLLYDAHTKPGYMKDFMMQSLTPSSVVSFFIFIAISQKTNYLFYKAGRHFDKKFLKTMAPHMGLASGFFISSLATELYQDPDFRQCVAAFAYKKIGKEDAYQEDQKHISSCEKSYAKWIQSKWSDYAVDIVALLGASWISHKIVRTLLIGIRATPSGGAWLLELSKRLGPRVMGGMGFFITIYVFMESHHFLEKYFGKSIKNYFKVDRIQSDLFALENMQKNLNEEMANLSDESEQSSDELNSLKTKVEDKIKLIGRRFSDWILLKGQDYQWSFSLWLQKTNKVTLFYQQSREILTNLYNQSVGSYDFNIDIMSQDKLPQSKGFVIDRDAFHKNRGNYIDIICFDSLINEMEEIKIQTWKKFCADPKNVDLNNEDLIGLAYESIIIISAWLDVSEADFNYLPYLGKNPEELFSSNPSYSLETLNLAEKMALVKSVLKDIYYSEDSVTAKILVENDYENVCLKKYSNPKEIQVCKSELYYKLRDKMLAFSIYVLKKQIFNPFILLDTSRGPNMPSGFMRQESLQSFLGFKNFQKIESLLEFLKVYKKGEIFFAYQAANYEVFKQEINQISNEDEIEKIKNYPYLFFQSIICGSQKKLKKQFVTPHLFKDLSHICERAYSDVRNPKEFHSALFSRPIEMKNKKYSNLWLLLEDYISSKFNSPEDLLEFFEEKSKTRIEQLSSKHLKELDHLNRNYLFPNTINSKVGHLKSCEEIMDYYNERNLRSTELKALELSLFQVIYWMNRLEKQYGVLSEKCEIIELLKEYHDSYTKDSGPYVYVSKKDLFEGIMENGLSSIKATHPNISIPVLVKPEMILSVILKDSPFYNKDNTYFIGILIKMLQLNRKSPQTFNGVEYALLYELKLSLDGFFQQLNLLRMKENMEQSLNLQPAS